jgi:hypothetical protein
MICVGLGWHLLCGFARRVLNCVNCRK